MSKTATRSDPLPIPTGSRDRLEKALDRLPFETHLSLEPLYRELERLGIDVPNIPALRGSITDPQILDAHQPQLRRLMGYVIPELMDEYTLVRAYAPFAPGSFFTTARYRSVFGAEGVEISQANGMGKREFYRENMLFAYRMLFHLHYDVPGTARAFVKRIRDTTTGLDRYFMNEGNMRFVDVDAGAMTMLPQQAFMRLLDMEDLEELERRLPLQGVTYSGFLFIRYVEISELHNLSLLKSELVEPNALRAPDRIQGRLRSVLGVEDLEVGMVLHYEARGGHGICNKRSLLHNFDGCMTGIAGSIYEEVLQSGVARYVADLSECDCQSRLVELLQTEGYRSIGLIPLLEEGEVIAILELGSRTPDTMSPSASRRLSDLLTPLTVAARREMEEVTASIAQTIKTHCTAIHPTVEWRFEEAAYQYTQEAAATGKASFAAIEFADVYPLFGAMDIRGSSASRNQAIEADLLEQLTLARETLAEVHAAHPMPIADYYDSVLETLYGSVSAGLSSGDEISVIEFLHTRIDSFLTYVRENVSLPKDEAGNDAVARYTSRLDPTLGIVYRKRQQYEHSVALINNTLASFTEQQQAKAQAIFPHYFEMFKTDGVEHSIYVGQSMTRDETFDEVQLMNLRLWQLQLMCETARIAEDLVAQMDVPLRTTPLVLVQSSPLTIQFSPDEKQFAVEGSYNIRYEIIKKRIDKSTIRGTNERLTQPGQLAVIYSQDREYDEYRRYFDYLSAKGYITPDFESLDLNDLQGVSGLRSLRGKIILDG